MMDIVSIYIVLHNLCIITNEKFDVIQIEEAEIELNKQTEDDIVKGGQVLQEKQISIEKIKLQKIQFD